MITRSEKEMKPILEKEILELETEIKKSTKEIKDLKKRLSTNRMWIAQINKRLSHVKDEQEEKTKANKVQDDNQ